MSTTLVRCCQRLRLGRAPTWFAAVAAAIVSGTTYAFLTDNLEHLPPTSGSLSYNADIRPGLGNTYVDPVFGSTVKQLTNIQNNSNDEQSYGWPYVNENGTLMFHMPISGGVRVIRVSDGSTAYNSVPAGLTKIEMRWSNTDPDVYYYYQDNGPNLRKYTLSTGSDVALKNFGATLQDLGGSVLSQDRTDRYFVVKYSGTIKVWDRQTDTIYAGNVPNFGGGGYAGITPDGKYVTRSGNDVANGTALWSHAIDHVNRRVDTTGVMFWNIGGAHATFLSASDGKNYALVENSNDATGVYAVDISVDRSGMSIAQQKASGRLLISLVPAFQDAFHMFGVVKGTFQDWGFVSVERVTPEDNFNSTPTSGNWYPFAQEIIAVNAVTGEKRRLAHHRSRGDLDTNYQMQPRVSGSVRGDVVVWNSNMNDSSPRSYADVYAIMSPLGAAGIPAPQNLRFR